MALTDNQIYQLDQLKADKAKLRAALASGEVSFSVQGTINATMRSAEDIRQAIRQINNEIRAILIDAGDGDLTTLNRIDYGY